MTAHVTQQGIDDDDEDVDEECENQEEITSIMAERGGKPGRFLSSRGRSCFTAAFLILKKKKKIQIVVEICKT